MVLAAAVDLLGCPRCGRPLSLGTQLRCPEGHAFDVARQGYVNLSEGPPPGNADTFAMVAARVEFLAGGHFKPIAAALEQLVPADAATLIEVGAGTGHHVAGLLADRPERRGIALDVSVPAIRRAARAHPRLAAVVSDVWRTWPVRDESIDLVLGVFAPRNADESARVLTRAGRLITVTPLPGHLAELRADLGLLRHRPGKVDQLERTLGARFVAERSEQVLDVQTWDAETARLSVSMGPNAFHLPPAELAARLAGLHWPRRVSVAARIDRWVQRLG